MPRRLAADGDANYDGRERGSTVVSREDRLMDSMPYKRAATLGVYLAARKQMSESQYEAWRRMGCAECRACGRAMVPCPKGATADDPGYCGYYTCECQASAGGCEEDGQ